MSGVFMDSHERGEGRRILFQQIFTPDSSLHAVMFPYHDTVENMLPYEAIFRTVINQYTNGSGYELDEKALRAEVSRQIRNPPRPNFGIMTIHESLRLPFVKDTVPGQGIDLSVPESAIQTLEVYEEMNPGSRPVYHGFGIVSCPQNDFFSFALIGWLHTGNDEGGNIQVTPTIISCWNKREESEDGVGTLFESLQCYLNLSSLELVI